MSKRIISVLVAFLALATTATATNIIVKPRLSVPNSNGSHTRAPMQVPSLYIEEYTLSIGEFYLGYTLQLVQDDQVVFTYQILTTDDLELPDTLSGEYELQLVGPVYTFVGNIEL